MPVTDLPTPETKAVYVKGLFDHIAGGYDRVNDWMTAGLHHGWKARLVGLLKPAPGEAALDLATDARLRAALKPETANATVIIVAQRISTIRDAEEIVVLDDGRIVGRGTHPELLADCATYQEIVASQLGAREVA